MAADTKTRQIFLGKRIAVTGILFLSYDGLRKAVEARGGMVEIGVTSATDFLVAGRCPGSRLQKAKRLGVKVLSITEFNEMVTSNEKQDGQEEDLGDTRLDRQAIKA
jgi:DNA ligase (NAD+)